MYGSPDIFRAIKSGRLQWAEHIARIEESNRAFKTISDKLTIKKTVRMPQYRWVDNIRIYLKEISVGRRYWIDSSKNNDYCRALVNATLNLRVP